MSLAHDIQSDLQEMQLTIDEKFNYLDQYVDKWENIDEGEDKNKLLVDVQTRMRELNNLVQQFEEKCLMLDYLDTAMDKGYHFVTN